MEQRRRLLLSRTTGLFCFECFPFETFSLSLSSSLSLFVSRLYLLLGSLPLPLPAARRGALPSSPFGFGVLPRRSARARRPVRPAASSLRTIFAPYDYLTTETAPTSTACTNCDKARHGDSRLDATNGMPLRERSAAHTTTRATLAPHDAVPEGHPSTTRHGSP